MNEEHKQRFEKWISHIRTNFGMIDDKAGIYVWALYEHLFDEIKQLNNTIQNSNAEIITYKQIIQSNGKTHEK